MRREQRWRAGGDSGIVKTLDQPVYIVTVIGDTVHALDRDGKTLTIQARPTCIVPVHLDQPTSKVLQRDAVVGRQTQAVTRVGNHPAHLHSC